jgi:hypothetical protein
MSIRITNNKNNRTIIIKNQDDMNHLDDTVRTVDNDDRKWDMFGNGEDDKNPYGQDSEFAPTSMLSDLKNRRAYKTNSVVDDRFDLDSFDADVDNHYIDVSKYPLSKEKESWKDPNTVFTPIIKLRDTDIPDDQTLDDMHDGNEFSLDDDPFAMGFDDESSELDGSEEEDLDSNDPNDPENSDDPEAEPLDFEGLIRTVRGAALVYKRKTQNGTYDELWIYNVGDNLKLETTIRKAILAGTDINPNTQQSDNGQQKAKTYSVGNVQFLNVTGLVQ